VYAVCAVWLVPRNVCALQIDLRALEARHRGGGLRPVVINRLVLYFKNPRAALSVFPSASLVLLGQRTVAEVEAVVPKIARLLAPFVVEASLPTATLRWNMRRGTRRVAAVPSMRHIPSEVLHCLGSAVSL
jgi:Transcription factor TFIID (or TATA-binding protein, TBP)